MSTVLDVTQSLSGQEWRWRSTSADARDPGFQPDDLVTQLLLARGASRETLDANRNPTIRSFMPDPSVFQDMDKAAERIADAILKREKVTIFGDYDVDGATSAALLIRLLRALGLEAGYYIPDRLMEGYGPSGEALVKLGQQGSDLVVTVDCGAMAFEALNMARAANVEVIVVDHHKCAAELPDALALVNPNRLDESDAGAEHGHLAAVGMAFLLGAAIIRTLRQRDYFRDRPEPRLLELLDIVALGTVADVAQLRGLNRAFVAQGLKVLSGRKNIGMSALIDASRLKRAPISSDLGFALGPRINAGGRVGKSDLGVRLLTTEDPEEARTIATELDHLNQERRAIEAHVLEEAEAMCRNMHNQEIAVLSGKGWHPGVIGIVASRIKEKLNRPAIIVAEDDAGIGKGSGRSIAGVDLGAAIIAAKDSGLLIAGGGHAMAAGITIESGKIPAFTEFLNEHLADRVGQARSEKSLLVDAVLSPRGVNPLFVEAMEEAGPFGMGWPAPKIVAGPVRIIKCDIVGKDHVRLIVSGDDGGSIKAIAFRAAETDMGQALLSAPKSRKLWIAGRAKIDDWGSRPAAEIHVEDAAWAD
ncbi:exonuclease RecJ [Parasphingorhabdus marina DSM 22363]|uniref:Single-stranded-DNA-specific exonuclease RecJ n=1 Tax=Parasphingorhabdus marina DSM 22363 TaxID=1123272 RepID=A0A1N6D4Q0_9SPHN|nr:single-stranded-DNA-specific exonuclease RecJ [Parasphingorhabdus marina]SIN65772.1 exonuclease RecJ [Parasphingorhabdus marina DSM 22363]